MHETLLASGFEFPEGPVCDPDGSVYVVEIRGERISRIAPDGSVSVVARPGGGPNGAARGPDGALYVTNNGGFAWRDGRPVGPATDYETARIERITADGHVQRLYDSCDGAHFSAVNDLVFDEVGNFYFTDPMHRDPHNPERMGTPTKRRGSVYYAAPDGSMVRRVVTDLQHPNGIGLTVDGKTLLVAQTFAGDLLAFPITAPGELGAPRLFGQLPQGYYPDGFCLDEEGYVLVAGPIGGGIVVFDSNGKLVETIQCADKMVTNCAFGGPNRSTLYVTESGLGQVVTFEWPRPGLVLWPDR